MVTVQRAGLRSAFQGGDPAVLEAQGSGGWPSAARPGPGYQRVSSCRLGTELHTGRATRAPRRGTCQLGAKLSGRPHQRPVSHAVLAHIRRRADLRAALDVNIRRSVRHYRSTAEPVAAPSLAREGTRVTICARTEADLQAAAEEIWGETGAEVLAVPADLTTA